MSILLIMAAFGTNAVAAPELRTCEHLDAKYVISHVAQIDDVMYINPTSNIRPLRELIQYWRRTCSDERFIASKDVVIALSSLLLHEEAILVVSSMLIDIGPNLKESERNVEVAIVLETASEDAMFKAASPVVPTSGRALSNSLKCVKRKISTGNLGSECCNYIKISGY